MAEATRLITVQFLQWVASRRRTYGEVQLAWQSTCPLTCAWEDAISDDLVRFIPAGETASQSEVRLTERGRAVLASSH